MAVSAPPGPRQSSSDPNTRFRPIIIIVILLLFPIIIIVILLNRRVTVVFARTPAVSGAIRRLSS